MTIWYTADLHINHTNLLKTKFRKFAAIGHMNSEILYNINRWVKPEDKLYILGDLCIHSAYNQLILEKHLRDVRCNYICVIKGNHDKSSVLQELKEKNLIHDYCDQKVITDKAFGLTVNVALFHYPVIDYHSKLDPDMCLHGHSHGTLQPRRPDLFDVGVDSWNFRPVTLEQILSKYYGDHPNPYIGFKDAKDTYNEMYKEFYKQYEGRRN